ncbi:MAG: EamA family transporter [Bdellovibrio bacteriovorus]
MDWLPLALLSAFSLASVDAATKAWLQDFSARELALVRLGGAGLLLSPLLADLPPLQTLPPPFWGWLAALVPLELTAMLLYMRAIRDHPLSLTLPYLAFTPVLAIAVAWALLGERVSLQGAVGILLVVAGAWLLNGDRARRHDWRSWADPLRAILREPGPRLMLAVAAIYAVTSTLGKAAMTYMAPEDFGAFYFAVLGVGVLLLFALPNPGSLRKIARRPLPVLAAGLLMAVMAYSHFLALQQTEVAYMIAVKRTSLLFGILYGALLFREPGLARRLPAGILMVSGVALILL